MPRPTCPSVICAKNVLSQRMKKTARLLFDGNSAVSIPPPRSWARGKEAFVKRSTLQWRFLNVGVPLLVLILGSVFAAGQLAANPTTVSFGNVVVGSSSTQSFVLTNTSNWNISISQAAVSGSGFASSFTAPVALASGASTQVTIAYAPQTTGSASGTASFTFSVNKTNNGNSKLNTQTATLGVGLSGSGIAAGQLSSNPVSISLSGVTGSSATQSGLLSNTGGASVTVSAASLTGSGFSLSGITLPVSLAPGQSATFNVSYVAQTTGTVTGNLAFANNGSNPTVNVGLSGTDTTAGTLAPTPTSDSFGSVQVGSTQSVYQTITNSGGTSVSLSQAAVTGAGFSISGLTLPATLNPGQSLSFTVSFLPTVAGSVTGSISITSNASNPSLAIGLSGTGTASGQLTLTPTSANFGTVTVGSTSTQSGSISASGSSVTISSGSINSSEFLLSGITFPVTLAAGQSVPVTLTFAPQLSGTAAATLSFVSNASNSPTSSLSGTGGTLTHSVGLTWSDSSTGIAGFNIYRSGVSGGPYSGINTGLDATASYTDTTVVAGQTYYYVVTAVDGTGTESAYSNEAAATVPTP